MAYRPIEQIESLRSLEPAPTFLPKTKVYAPGSKLLPHELRYDYAVSAYEECITERNQGFPLTEIQKTRILQLLNKEKMKFLGFDVVGWLAIALNFALYVPVLIQAIQTPENGTNLILTWISLINQIFWLAYAIGIRSYPILILSILLIPLLIVVLIYLYL